MKDETASLDEKTILEAFARLSAKLNEAGVRGEVCVMGGACMVLAFKARETTKDVDVVAEPAALVLRQAFRVGQEMNLPTDWLNNAVRLYVSKKQHEVREFNVQFPNLHILVPTTEYMLAMKCLSARIATFAQESDDRSDIKFLIKHLNLQTTEQVRAIVEGYYPPERIPVRVYDIVDAAFAELVKEKREKGGSFHGR